MPCLCVICFDFYPRQSEPISSGTHPRLCRTFSFCCATDAPAWVRLEIQLAVITPVKLATASPATTAIGQFWLARFEKRLAERFAGANRDRSSAVQSASFGGGGRAFRNVGGRPGRAPKTLSADHLPTRVTQMANGVCCWQGSCGLVGDGLIEPNSRPWSCQCADGTPYAERMHTQEWASYEGARIAYKTPAMKRRHKI
jgi:hypothetical protein